MKLLKSIVSTVMLLTLMLFVQNCKKIEQVVGEAPVISATNPTENGEYANGQILQIKGDVSDTEGLKTFEVTITDDVTKVVLFKSAPNVLDLKSYKIDIPWTIKVNDWVEATVKISTTNKSGIKAEKAIRIKIWV